VQWDYYCVWAAMTICGPPPGVCGEAGHDAYSQGGPGCDDIDCCESVCAGDPTCCTVAWDTGCIGLANLFCGPNFASCGAAGHDLRDDWRSRLRRHGVLRTRLHHRRIVLRDGLGQ